MKLKNLKDDGFHIIVEATLGNGKVTTKRLLIGGMTSRKSSKTN
jgi:hypothetical protein